MGRSLGSEPPGPPCGEWTRLDGATGLKPALRGSALPSANKKLLVSTFYLLTQDPAL